MRKLLTARQLEALKACDQARTTGAPNTSSGDKWHKSMQELQEMGFVSSVRHGRKFFWSITDAGEAVLAREGFS
jgi:hypothetical protein